MASLPAIFSVTIVDQYGIAAQSLINVVYDDTKTLAQLNTELASLASNFAALSQGIITHTSFKVVHETGVDPATATGDVEKGSLYNFSNATDSYSYGIWIPDVQPTILDAHGLVDLTNADVIAFVSAMTTAGTVLTPVGKGARALVGLVDALISFRKRRKPLARKTKEVG